MSREPEAPRKLQGMVVAHVDDLLMAGSAAAEDSLMMVGAELGLGSVEKSDFQWCGKRIRRAKDGTIRLSMEKYHQNLREVSIAPGRKRDLESNLTDFERRHCVPFWAACNGWSPNFAWIWPLWFPPCRVQNQPFGHWLRPMQPFELSGRTVTLS